ncbi:MAG: twin-arginine translocase subunit TatC [Hydrogenophaga sp.]|uniref:twin-arginine translocase subunit TatC n=1 Tax=Hydrogenophaga sp. TaxID=1904254 RepID=UPI002616D96B|nr:twin-arginine translocase subunit TatC [Hydrogenophaga sp.]MCW5672841.1 twin-arginine translocase subunit TatC [Hydrogenophaga sp.]
MTTAETSEHDEPEDDVKMTIWEHLGELRKRLGRAAIGLVAGACVCWAYRQLLLDWLMVPYAKAWGERFPELVAAGQKPELQTLAPADAFVNYMQLALVGGVILATPIVFYQLWAFISPGLYSREKRYIIPFVVFSTTLFTSGVAFAYYVALPFSFPFFFSLLGEVGSQSGVVLTTKPTMEYYLDFAEHMLLAFGFVFELPLFIGFLALAGIVTPQQLVKFSRYAIVGAFVVGAFVTPGPEISSQIAVSSALIALYFLSVGLAFLIYRKKKDA